MTSSQINSYFDDAPLMLAIAHIGFTQSPEILQRITEIKAGLAKMDLLIAESKQQTNVALNPAGGIPQVTYNPFWWFASLDRRRAIAVGQNSVVLYDADYGRFDRFLDRVKKMSGLVGEIAGAGCFLTAVALRYISGFASDGTPSPYICAGLHGIPVQALKTTHFHHEYSFWCDTEGGGRLVVQLKTVHGNQLIAQDILSTGLVIDPKFSLNKEIDAVQLDIHETVQKRTMERLSVAEIERITSSMRSNIKTAFLSCDNTKGTRPMETQAGLEDCLTEKPIPGNQWLAKCVLVAGTSCLTASFPSPGIVDDLSPPELRLPEDRQFMPLPKAQEGSSGCPGLSSPVETHLEGLIRHLAMPKSWIDERIEGPTEDCKHYSFQVVRRLFRAYGIIPYKITVSKNGGVFAAYKNPHNKYILRIEVDNELDVVAVVSDGEAILDSGLLEGDDLERSLLGSFDSQLARAFSLPGAPGSFSL